MVHGNPRMTGGCQCGAVRFAVQADPVYPHICHCRMCQKAFGGPFAALANVRHADFAVTRGRIARFRSSQTVQRGFCADCGTPLTCEDDDSDHLSVAICSFDDPGTLAPERQIGTESRMPWFATLDGLPAATSEQAGNPDEIAAIRATSHQHPDHDTQAWPPAGPDTEAGPDAEAAKETR